MLLLKLMSTPTGLQFEYVTGGLIVRVTGRRMIEQKEASILEIAEEIRARPVSAAIVDLRGLAPPYSFMDRYQIGELTAVHLSHVNIAALVLETQMDKQRIGQLVAVNRGAKVELFTDEAAALEWLKNHTSPSP